MISDGSKVGDYTFVLVSDAGFSHRINNVPNQDAVMYEVDNEDFAIAVSDGVGSCQKADAGSKNAVEATRKVFLKIKKGEISFEQKAVVKGIIEAWKQSIESEDVDDYCATLKAAIKVGNDVLLISIGDGILAVTSNGISQIAPTDEWQFINQTSCLSQNVNETDFWTSMFVLDTYVPFVIFVCTDGVANGITEGKELELVRELETGIDSMRLKDELERLVVSISDYSADDRSIGVVKYERKNAESVR